MDESSPIQATLNGVTVVIKRTNRGLPWRATVGTENGPISVDAVSLPDAYFAALDALKGLPPREPSGQCGAP